MREVKAIETKYNGYRFRSRLEARWAVFFDGLGLKYEYELERFSLRSGAAYLPDFYIPALDVFVEVKPHDRFPWRDLKKMVEFALEGDRQLLLVTGSPTNETMYLFNRVTATPADEFSEETDEPLPEEELTPFFLETQRDWCQVKFSTVPKSRQWTLMFAELPPNDDAELTSALSAGKTARFEFGENG